jgi:hypothetical protein
MEEIKMIHQTKPESQDEIKIIQDNSKESR